MKMNCLRELRGERNLSQQALAEMVSTSQQNIYKYENGITEPDIQMLKALADVFHVSVDFLVEHETHGLEGDIGMDIGIPSSHQIKRLNSDLIHLLVSYERCRPEIREHLLSIADELAKGSNYSGDEMTQMVDGADDLIPNQTAKFDGSKAGQTTVVGSGRDDAVGY